ncbi:MAG: RusA family crossover junction endodeoxyribonuclease [Bacilli bacterium]|jgi:Holliday junction resolvase RusA-like endonuclease|nr:RusA family crossover junction endodeoxyribonuclease [Acholeplasmataceae bacterium]
MKIFLIIDPPTITAQQNKVTIINGRPIFYKPEKLMQARRTIIKHLKPFKPDKPMEGPISLNVIWRFPKGKKNKHFEWRVTKPDTDNLEKMLKDCMTEVGFWIDDAQVVLEHVEKVWSDEPTGIIIEINILSKFKEESE